MTSLISLAGAGMSAAERRAALIRAARTVTDRPPMPADLGPCARCGTACVRYGPHGHVWCVDCGGPDRPAPPAPRVPAAPPRTLPTLLTAALTYAAHGWPVFLLSSGKTPLALCRACREAGDDHDRERCECLTCHGFYAATRNPTRIRDMVDRHPTGLLAIRTSAPSGLVVIDVDPDNGGHDTLTALDEQALLPGTLMVETGTGGLHLFYAHPGAPVKSGARLLGGPGVDVKADGGYVVAAPSRHPRTREPYRWCGDGRHDHPPAPLHPKLAARLLKTTPHQPLAAPAFLAETRPFNAPSDPAGRLAGLLRTVIEAPQGQRNETLNWAAYKAAEMVRDRVAAEPAVVAALTEAAAHAGLHAGEIGATIASGLRAGRTA